MGTRLDPIDIEIQSPLLPYLDLLLQGDPKRTLHIPQDVLLTLSGLIGLHRGVPRMAQMSPSGALFVAEAGGGNNDFSSQGGNLNAGLQQNVQFSQVCNLVYFACRDADFELTVLVPAHGISANFHLLAGFQAFIPVIASLVQITNNDAVSGTFSVAGFFNNPAFPLLQLP